MDEMRYETVREVVVCKWRDVFIFSYKGNLIFLFFTNKNSIRRHASLLLVLTKCFRGDETILI